MYNNIHWTNEYIINIYSLYNVSIKYIHKYIENIQINII